MRHIELLVVDIHEPGLEEIGIEAIVNSTNSEKPGWSGLDQRLYEKGGELLRTEAEKAGLYEAKEGDVLVTSAPKTGYKYVLHVIFPKWEGPASEPVIRKCYRKIFKTASERGIKSILIPALGTGHNKMQMLDSARIAAEELHDFIKEDDVVEDFFFVLRQKSAKKNYEDALDRLNLDHGTLQKEIEKYITESDYIKNSDEKERDKKKTEKEEKEKNKKKNLEKLKNDMGDIGNAILSKVKDNPELLFKFFAGASAVIFSGSFKKRK